MPKVRETDILHEAGDYWVKRVARGFEVYRNGLTHAVRVASVGDGPGPRLGIERAKAEADRLYATDFVATAQRIATEAHAGQTRAFGPQAGQPYIIHPTAVAGRFQDDPVKQAIGWLHDTVEDTAKTDHPVTFDDLRAAGLPEEVVTGVDAMTRRQGEAYHDFVVRCSRHPHARHVKLADLGDNMATLPEGHGLRKRYVKALVLLAEAE